MFTNRRKLIFGALAALAVPTACVDRAKQPRYSIALIDMRARTEHDVFKSKLSEHLAFRLGVGSTDIALQTTCGPYGNGLREAIELTLRNAPSLVIAISARAALACRAASPSTPVVFSTQVDPVAAGLVNSLALPMRRATGVWNDLNLHCKRLELINRVFPSVRSVCVLQGSTSGNLDALRVELAKCGANDVATHFLSVNNEQDLLSIRTKLPSKVDAIVIPHSDICSRWPDSLVASINALNLPAIFDGKWLVDRGGLMSLEPLQLEESATLAEIAAKALSGVNIDLIPVERPRTTRVSLNLNTAQTQRLQLPGWLLKVADEVVYPTTVGR